MNQSKLKIFGYVITGDPDEPDHPYHFGDEVHELMSRTLLGIQKGKINNPQKLLKLVDKYPHVPAFQNYLYVFYMMKEKYEKAQKVLNRLLEQHPDYLFGKLNLANEFLANDKLDEIPGILGQALDLQDLYPERKVFHTTEFQSFLQTSCMYLIEKGELDVVESRLEPAREALGADNPVIQDLENRIRREIIMGGGGYWDLEDDEGELEEWEEPSFRSYDTSVQTDEPPSFHHPEIHQLYEYGLEIDPDILRSILELPRETLLADLETVLEDSLNRFDYFTTALEKEELEYEMNTSFSLHALFLLTELQAVEKLPAILEHLRQGEDFLEHWYGDHTTETLWRFLYHLGSRNLDLLRDFVQEKETHYLARWAATSAVTQVGLHQPDHKQEVIDWFESLMDFFITRSEERSYYLEVSSMAICSLINLKATSLLPKIRHLFDLGLVDPSVPGFYEDVERDINKDEQYGKYSVFGDIFSHYQHILTTWYCYMTLKQQRAQDRKFRELDEKVLEDPELFSKLLSDDDPVPDILPVSTAPKVGRNDPCPCGSGKKYKKCCWKKK